MSSLTNTRIPPLATMTSRIGARPVPKKWAKTSSENAPNASTSRCRETVQSGLISSRRQDGALLLKGVSEVSDEGTQAALPTGTDFAEALSKDKELEALNAAFSKWLDCWRNTINHYALCAHDLANHPQDRLATHCFVLEVKQRPNAPSVAQSFKAPLFLLTYVDDELTKSSPDAKQVDHWRKDYRGEDTVHTVIIFDAGTARFLWYSLGDLTQYRSDPIASRKLAEGCWTGLTYSFETGKGAITMPISMP
ncbi:hypothetical protein A0H81_09041 [Grifola frondosa]|uniref:Uncharacterized protein n=1 Tax=Grifola frondosa TaxID=5627 RepID=A0A1C7M293_GRIFR|nr:hypothetical protein A0H81_09041 [Grifola frondosa]